MALAGTPNTISFHPDVSLSIDLLPNAHLPVDSPESGSSGVYVAGETVEGVFKVHTAQAANLSLGAIQVECIAREDARTSQRALGRIFWSFNIPFQGRGLPISNAVTDDRVEGLPKGYHPARKGTTSFHLRIPLPAGLPASFSSAAGSITYTLHASVELAKEYNRHVLHTSHLIQLVPPPSSFDRLNHEARKVYAEFSVPLKEGGGQITLQLSNSGQGRWAVEGQSAWLEARVLNSSAVPCRATHLRLLKILEIDLGPNRHPAIMETVEREKDLGNLPCEVGPNDERTFTLDMKLPPEQRSSGQAAAGTSINLWFSLQLVLQVNRESDRTITATLPIEIFHPLSLPPGLRVEYEALCDEMRTKAHPALQARIKASRRWSTPIEILSGYFAPERPLPAVPRKPTARLGLPPIPKHARPVGYSQPEWIVHHMPTVREDAAETKAERTSRHLRETSGHRGRSVSPPPPHVPLSPPRFSRRSSVVGPRPAPGRSSSTPSILVGRSQSQNSSPQLGGSITPPILSPMPVQIEPNSYFDQHVHSLEGETPLDLGKLSPATILSLENFAENLEPAPDSSGTQGPASEENTGAVPRPGSRSPVRERRSVLEFFAAVPRPEARRRESSERRVAVETRNQREASCVAEVFDEGGEGATQELPGPAVYPYPASTGASDQVPLEQPATPPQVRSSKGSIRGLRAQVKAVKRQFDDVEEPATPPSSSGAEKRVRRKSVPPVTGSMLLDPPPSDTSAKRRSMAADPSSLEREVSPASTATSSVQRVGSRAGAVTLAQSPSPVPTDLTASRPKRKTFETADAKERDVKGRGPIGRLRALIERFERL